MTEYVVLLPGNEATWEAADAAAREAMYGKHREFAQKLAERGHKVTGGAELTHSREARVLRGSGDQMTITEGPYAETVEQLTGFYTVQSDDLDDLLQVCGIIAGSDGAIEVRALTGGSAGPA